MDALACVDTGTMVEILGYFAVGGGSTAAFEGLDDKLQEELKAMLSEALSNPVEVRVPPSVDLKQRLKSCSNNNIVSALIPLQTKKVIL